MTKMDKKDKRIKFLTIALIILIIALLQTYINCIEFKKSASDHFDNAEKCDIKCTSLEYFSYKYGYANNGTAFCICAIPDREDMEEFIGVDINA